MKKLYFLVSAKILFGLIFFGLSIMFAVQNNWVQCLFFGLMVISMGLFASSDFARIKNARKGIAE